MKKIIIILLIALSSTAFSAISDFKCRKTPGIDGWSIGHALGCGVFYAGLRAIDFSPKESFWIVVSAGIFYEIVFDGYQNDLFGTCDPNGADLIGDVAFDILGAGFAAMIDLGIRIHCQHDRIEAGISLKL